MKTYYKADLQVMLDPEDNQMKEIESLFISTYGPHWVHRLLNCQPNFGQTSQKPVEVSPYPNPTLEEAETAFDLDQVFGFNQGIIHLETIMDELSRLGVILHITAGPTITGGVGYNVSLSLINPLPNNQIHITQIPPRPEGIRSVSYEAVSLAHVYILAVYETLIYVDDASPASFSADTLEMLESIIPGAMNHYAAEREEYQENLNKGYFSDPAFWTGEEEEDED